MPQHISVGEDGQDDGASSLEDDADFGMDIELYDELETLLVNVESQSIVVSDVGAVDMEDIASPARLSPLEEFRKKGWLSVSDLVGTIWCEVQYDYRLRTLPFLPPSQRPQIVTSKQGAAIPVDKVKVDDRERILRRGEKIHKRLEREIHPEEIVVHAVTREDVWGLRFLNMFSALEALLTLGKCREFPVVGFVRGILVMGVIDEITRVSLDAPWTRPNTHSAAKEDRSQTSLTSYFSPTKPRAKDTFPKPRTHKLFVSDSKTRASGTVPRESDTLAGRFQVMLYKELLDAMLLARNPDPSDCPSVSHEAILPTEKIFSWIEIFQHLALSISEPFSEDFVVQSRPIIAGNRLLYGVEGARTLENMLVVWQRYIEALGLGSIPSEKDKSKDKGMGRTEDRLKLVYRRAGAKHRRQSSKNADVSSRRSRDKRRQVRETTSLSEGVEMAEVDDDEQLQLAIEDSLRTAEPAQGVSSEDPSRSSVRTPNPLTSPQAKIPQLPKGAKTDAEDDELAWAVEMSLGAGAEDMPAEEKGEVVLRVAQPCAQEASSVPSTPSTPTTPTPDRHTPTTQSSPSNPSRPEESISSASGSIIGRTVFTHSPRRLAAHLSSVLEWWLGERDAVGVSIEETRRCGWCEFEEGCEWRARKAEEAMERSRRRKALI